jgi:tRNA A-37 threonylcarbamoyl transferase component Bud32
MSSRPTPPAIAPGTLTSLLNEVIRGTGPDHPALEEGLAPGTALGRYDLIREIGRGGSGVVWEARDRELGRRVAVKVIRVRTGSPEKRLIAEAEVAARLSHPGIVTILDVGRNDRGAWLVQEFLVGRTLASRIAEGPLPLREALGIATKVASALAYAHGHGVIHRDLTPANVFLCEDGQVKILDLGMAQAFGRRKVEGGTPDFMAPEQAQGLPEDERVDVYALGVLLYRMVTGRSPRGEGAALESAAPPHLHAPGLPGLGELLDRMLAAAPGDRPRDAAAVLAEFERLTATVSWRSETGPTGVVRVRRRWPRWALASSALLLVAAAASGGAVLGRSHGVPGVTVAEPVVFGAAGLSGACQWGKANWLDLDRLPEETRLRGGRMGGQGVADVEGRRAWKVTSDWGQVLLPLGAAASGDPFAVEIEFFIPPVTRWKRGVELAVFTEAVGSPSAGDLAHGVGITVAEEPGKAPWFEWYQPDGKAGSVRRYVGSLPRSPTGTWHTLRVEGSRSRRWFRGLLDGVPIVVAAGDLDLSGSRIVLGAGYGYMNPVDVAFSNLRTFSGTPECQ